MRIRLTDSVRVAGRHAEAHSTIEVGEHDARVLIAMGRAVPEAAGEEAPSNEGAPPKADTMARPARKRTRG